MTRRDMLWLLASGARAQQPTGMASRGVAPQPRGKPSGLPFHGRFTDIAAQAGLREPVIYGPDGRTDYVLESMGCGVAFLDYDNDGWLDVFVLSGTRREGPVAGATNRLYRNDNDGFDDIFISQWGQNVLYRNNGNGTFTDVTREAGLLHEGTRWGTGCTWVDYNRDGLLDLFVAHYLVFGFQSVPATGRNPKCNFRGVPVYCGPLSLQPERCLLYRNNGDGTFTDVTRSAGIDRAAPTFGLTAVAADYFGSGWPDIYVASDSMPSLLFRNQRDGSFAEQGLQLGLAVNEDGTEQAGMGLGLGDFDTDGALDL